MEEIAGWMKVEFLGNNLQAYLRSIVIFFVAVLLLRFLEYSVFKRLRKIAEKTPSKADDFVIALAQQTVIPLLYAGAFYLAANQLVLNPAVSKLVRAVGVIVLTFQLIRLVLAVLIYFLEENWFKKQPQSGQNPISRSILTVIKGMLWGLGILLMLDNLGFNVSAVVAGLGISGVAVALAAQTILGDVFNYFVIFFDKPFEEGDNIIFEEYNGTVEHIGIKSTRIRAAGGEQIVVANSLLTASKIRNYKRMMARQVILKLGIVYETPLEKVKKIPEVLRGIIEKVPNTRFERAHFASLGDFSLNFEVVYFVNNRDYQQYMDVQQKINLAVLETFEKDSIEFAYPTQMQYQKEIKN